MNPRVVLSIALLLVATSFVPLAGGQTNTTSPVPSCSKQCAPKDADVNPAVPITGDAPTNMIMYGHFEDALNQALLNVELPNVQCTKDLNEGFLMPVVSPQGLPAQTVNFANNEFTMLSSAGKIEYDNECGKRVHEEPGTAEDMTITTPDVTLYFYLAANAGPGQTGSTTKSGVLPGVAIYARMETGRHYTHGQEIAVGDTGKDDVQGVTGSPGRINVISTPQGEVYEFVVPMKVTNPVIKSIHNTPNDPLKWGFIVTIIPYQVMVKDGPAKGSQVMQEEWRFRSSVQFPPRIVFGVDKAMQTKPSDTVHPLSTFRDNMFIRWSFVSPFGSYDADDASLKLTITGPTPVDTKALAPLVILKRSINHDGHFTPINATWKFDYRKAGLADGKYEVAMEILNLQGTYVLKNVYSFDVSGGQLVNIPAAGGGVAGANNAGSGGSGGSTKSSPGVETALFAIALLGVAIVRRRSQ